MSQRLNEYFAQESSEYLGQLEQLLARPGAPDPERLLGLARGVRGSAQMAGAETIAGVAERLEDAARSVLSNNVVWSEEIRRLATQTVRDLQILVRALHRWGPDEETRVRLAIERWDDLEHAAEGAGSAPGVVPIAALFYDDTGPHVLSSPRPASGAGPGVVPIESLLLRGEAALREAVRLQPEIERALHEQSVADPALDALLRELFDLVRLGLPAESPAA